MKKYLALLFLPTILAVALLLLSSKALAAFNSSDLIDDSYFDNVNSMSGAQIDTFLNSFPASCISSNNGFSSPDPTGYSPSGGFTYGGNVSAGRVIYDAANAYGLNPQVLITTLQKEQSLVTGSAGCHPSTPDPTSSFQCNLYGNGVTYNCTSACPYSGGCVTIAVGYGCPGNCNAADEGFSNQLIHAAWLLKFSEQRSEGNTSWNVQKVNSPQNGDVWDNSDDPPSCYSGPMTQGYRALSNSPSGCGGSQDNVATYWDGYTVIDGTSTYINNGATAALYRYTPHFSGNENFDNIYEGWFGPVIGSLVQAFGDTTVYLLSGTTAYPIYDVNVLNDLYPLGPVRQTSASEINNYKLGPTASRLYKGSDGTVYLINSGIKLAFSDCNMVADYGYNCNNALPLTDGQINSFVNGPPVTPLLKAVSNPTVYYVSGGQKRPIPSWADAQAFQIPIMNTLTDTFVNSIPFSAAYAYGPGSLVKTLNSPSVYVVKDINNLLPLNDFLYSQEIGLGSSVRTIASYYTVLNSNLLTKVQCNGTNYIGTSGVAYQVSSAMMTAYGFQQPDFIDGGAACLNLPISTQSLGQFIRAVTDAIFYVTGGQKEYVTSMAVYQAHGGNSSNTIPVSNYFLNLLADGPPLSQ